MLAEFSKSERIVDAMVHGEVPVPPQVEPLVRKYRAYEQERRNLVSYPLHVDQAFNSVYESMCVLVSVLGVDQ